MKYELRVEMTKSYVLGFLDSAERYLDKVKGQDEEQDAFLRGQIHAAKSIKQNAEMLNLW